MSLAQQFARLERHFDRVAVELPHVATAFKEDLSAIERHVQEMETALELVEEMTAGRAGVSGIADIARTALAAREKGTE